MHVVTPVLASPSMTTGPRRQSRGLRGFAEALAADSDHACAALAGSALDALLTELFLGRMTAATPSSLFEGTGALATFSAKVDVSFGLGWISGAERADLHVVREVSGLFARDVRREFSFASEAIRAACEPLQLANAFLAEAGMPDSVFAQEAFGELRTNARQRFEMTIEFLRQALIYRASQGTQAEDLPDVES